MIELTPSQINYLYVIYILEKPTVTGVANYLEYSKPSVIKAFNSLEELGLLIYDKKKIKLTEKGLKYAKNYSARKNAMVMFLTDILKIDKNQAEIDADKIMQVISCKTTVALNNYLAKELGMEIIDIHSVCLGECLINKKAK